MLVCPFVVCEPLSVGACLTAAIPKQAPEHRPRTPAPPPPPHPQEAHHLQPRTNFRCRATLLGRRSPLPCASWSCRHWKHRWAQGEPPQQCAQFRLCLVYLVYRASVPRASPVASTRATHSGGNRQETRQETRASHGGGKLGSIASEEGDTQVQKRAQGRRQAQTSLRRCYGAIALGC